MTKYFRIEVANYGELQIPIPPKKYRTKENLFYMVSLAVEQTHALLWAKTIDDFRTAIDILTPEQLTHKHIYKLDEIQPTVAVLWVCDCGYTQAFDRHAFYSEMTGSD